MVITLKLLVGAYCIRPSNKKYNEVSCKKSRQGVSVFFIVGAYCIRPSNKKYIEMSCKNPSKEFPLNLLSGRIASAR
jgi:hypothetical protein